MINYFFFIAEEVRELLAEMGFTKLDDIIGQSDLLDTREALNHWKAEGLDFTRMFTKIESESPVYRTQAQEHPIFDILDRKLIEQAMPALDDKSL